MRTEVHWPVAAANLVAAAVMGTWKYVGLELVSETTLLVCLPSAVTPKVAVQMASVVPWRMQDSLALKV